MTLNCCMTADATQDRADLFKDDGSGTAVLSEGPRNLFLKGTENTVRQEHVQQLQELNP